MGEWRWDEREVGGEKLGNVGGKKVSRGLYDRVFPVKPLEEKHALLCVFVCVQGLLSFPTHLALSTCTISGDDEV